MTPYFCDMLIDKRDRKDFIEHHGRKGMKWYKHIFGEYQDHARYAGGKKTKSKKQAKAEKPKKEHKSLLKRFEELSERRQYEYNQKHHRLIFTNYPKGYKPSKKELEFDREYTKYCVEHLGFTPYPAKGDTYG